MVEMGFPHPKRLAEWHDWYMEHIKVLLTVPGFRASQRFEAVVDNASPYLALHEVASAAIFESEAYRNRGGPSPVGEWRSLQTNWHRNLLDEMDETPEVPLDAYLLLLRDARDVVLPAAIGLDGTINECGLAVLSDIGSVLDLARGDERVRVFRPISEKVRAGG